MKTEVYSWRLAADRKAALERGARRMGTSVADVRLPGGKRFTILPRRAGK